MEARRGSIHEVLVGAYLVAGLDDPPAFAEREEMIYQRFVQLVEQLRSPE